MNLPVTLEKRAVTLITGASAGIGAASHVSGELFKMMAGVNLVHIPYRGSPPALTDLLAGAGAGHVPRHCLVDRVY